MRQKKIFKRDVPEVDWEQKLIFEASRGMRNQIYGRGAVKEGGFEDGAVPYDTAFIGFTVIFQL